MTSQISSSLHSESRAARQARDRADSGADVARVLVALGVLALLASFNGADDARLSAAAQPAGAGLAASQP